MAKAIITGGAGFIGSNMADRLLADGWKVKALDSMKSGHKEFFEHNLSNPDYEFVEADIMDLAALKKEFAGADVVFHFAANADIKACLKQPEVDYKVNAGGTFNVLEAMRANGVKKIVFSSTGSVYGEPEVFPTPEDAPFPVQTSMYAAAKLYSEALISSYCEGYGFDGYVYRFVSIIGERYTHGVVFSFMKQLAEHPDHIDFLSDGTPLKSYLYVGDCIEGILHGLKHGKKGFNVFNLGTDEARKVSEMADYVVAKLGLTGVKYNPSQTKRGWIGDSPHIHLDITKLRSLGWEPKKTIKEAVGLTVEYIKANKWVVNADYFRGGNKRE